MQSFLFKIRPSVLISVNENWVVLNSFKDYRPAAQVYINASFISVSCKYPAESRRNISAYIV